MQELPTKQELFDTMYRGLASQGFERSLDEQNKCAYRGCANQKCAAGWLIPDDKYMPRFEGVPVIRVLGEVFFGKASVEQLTGDEHDLLSFVRKCQNIHDLTHLPHLMRGRLEELASAYDLTIPTLPAPKVTEAMVEAAREIIHGARHVYSDEDLARAALKAAMEAGR